MQRTFISRLEPHLVTMGATAVQAVVFLLLARALGPGGYAVIVGVAVIATVCGELVGFGAGDKLISDVAGGRRVNECFGEAIFKISVTLPIAFGVGVAALFFIAPSPQPLTAYFLLCSEILSLRLFALFEHLHIASGSYFRAARLRLIFALIRLAAVFGFLFYSTKDLEIWLVIQAVTATAVPLVAFAAYSRRHVESFFRTTAVFDLAGLNFMLVQLIRALQGVADRIGTITVMSPIDTGLYGTAARFTTMSYMPIGVVLKQRYRAVFDSRANIDSAVTNFRATAFSVAKAGAFAASLMLIIALVCPYFLGSSFLDVRWIVLGLVFVPFFQGFQNMLLDYLMIFLGQNVRTGMQLAMCLIALSICFLMARSYGVFGLVVGVNAAYLLNIALVLIVLSRVTKILRLLFGSLWLRTPK